MKPIKISKKQESKSQEKASKEIAGEGCVIGKNDDSFENLFYSAIDVFAYSKFYEVVMNSKRIGDAKYLIFVKSLYNDFIEQKGFFDKNELDIFNKIVLVIDEFCVEKFMTFVNICNSNSKNFSVDDSINQFINSHNNILKKIKTKCEEDGENIRIESFIKVLHERDPKKFKELIDFEINKKELKESANKIKFVTDDIKIKPSTVFLNEIKGHSNLEKASLKKINQHSSCVIS